MNRSLFRKPPSTRLSEPEQLNDPHDRRTSVWPVRFRYHKSLIGTRLVRRPRRNEPLPEAAFGALISADQRNNVSANQRFHFPSLTATGTFPNCDFASIPQKPVVYNTRHSGGPARMQRVFAGSAKENHHLLENLEVAVV